MDQSYQECLAQVADFGCKTDEKRLAQFLQSLDSEEYGFDFPATNKTIKFVSFSIIQNLVAFFLTQKTEHNWDVCIWWSEEFTLNYKDRC